MSDVDELQQKEIEEIMNQDTNNTDELFELETILTEGTNAKIPYNFIYPNTNKRVGVLLKPLTTQEYTSAINRGKLKDHNFLTELLKISLFDLKENPFPSNKIEQLPAGVVTGIVTKISEISGVEMAETTQINQSNLMEDLMGF